MPRGIPDSGKRHRPKTAVKGRRYLCAGCRKRSPRPVKTPAPWYCPKCWAALGGSRHGSNPAAADPEHPIPPPRPPRGG